jgi:hypothetical protein
LADIPKNVFDVFCAAKIVACSKFGYCDWISKMEAMYQKYKTIWLKIVFYFGNLYSTENCLFIDYLTRCIKFPIFRYSTFFRAIYRSCRKKQWAKSLYFVPSFTVRLSVSVINWTWHIGKYYQYLLEQYRTILKLITWLLPIKVHEKARIQFNGNVLSFTVKAGRLSIGRPAVLCQIGGQFE